MCARVYVCLFVCACTQGSEKVEASSSLRSRSSGASGAARTTVRCAPPRCVSGKPRPEVRVSAGGVFSTRACWLVWDGSRLSSPTVAMSLLCRYLHYASLPLSSAGLKPLISVQLGDHFCFLKGPRGRSSWVGVVFLQPSLSTQTESGGWWQQRLFSGYLRP